ncbi:MAG: phosphate ABC transporter substrate-binding protein [Gammaproteobacteria bacterium]|nr:phosphate ABC transporter substrate-binding protein [Gammaproteobacteria bacterium]
MKTIQILTASLFLGAVMLSLPLAAQTKRIPIQNRGSDSMAIAVAAWSEAYQDVDKQVGVAVSGGGSGTGIAAMINGLVDIANSSRPLLKKEIRMAKEVGINHQEHIVGYDAVTVYLHRDNPIQSLSFAQLGEIFGRGGSAAQWTDLGVNVPGCKDQQIVPVSRQSSSGTYNYFRKRAIGKKYRNKFRTDVLGMQGSKDLVELVAKTPCAIGYSSFAYATPSVKIACTAPAGGVECVEPSIEGITDGSYPMARPLYMYTNGQPEGEIKKYINWVISDEGQCILSRRQYAPLRKVVCGN